MNCPFSFPGGVYHWQQALNSEGGAGGMEGRTLSPVDSVPLSSSERALIKITKRPLIALLWLQEFFSKSQICPQIVKKYCTEKLPLLFLEVLLVNISYVYYFIILNYFYCHSITTVPPFSLWLSPATPPQPIMTEYFSWCLWLMNTVVGKSRLTVVAQKTVYSCILY